MAQAQAKAKLTVGQIFSKEPEIQVTDFWIVGDTPLIVHAWSEKAKQAMLAKQTKALSAGREERNPEEDFRNSLYEIGDGKYGFPAMGVKNAICSQFHKDKGLPREHAKAALFMVAPFYKVRPALSAAVCDMPLLRIFGSEPEMREDMVVLNGTTASLAYRGQFTTWAMKVRMRIIVSTIPLAHVTSVVNMAGMSCGIGDWRNERNGVFGSFHMASEGEKKDWEAFASGRTRTPPQSDYLKVAAE